MRWQDLSENAQRSVNRSCVVRRQRVTKMIKRRAVSYSLSQKGNSATSCN